MAVELRYPRFDVTFFTETDQYHISYDSRDKLAGNRNPDGTRKAQVSNNFMSESVISLTTKNAMEDDSAVFSFVLAGDVYWDRILQANDAVVLRIDPDVTSTTPNNPILLVGLVSEIRLEGDYGDNSKMYRITGQSFAKALMQFDLGVIQEVSVVLTDLGWLPDDAQEGIKMSGSSASQIAESLMKRFIQYMKFNFNGEGIDKFLEWDLDSWTEAERLIDGTPYINYEGSLKQLLDDVTAKPFNELFFDATPEGKCRMIMRRTPFDKADWEKLETFLVTSKDVVSESLATNDIEAFSIYNISINNLYGTDSMMLGSKPQVFPDLVNKYGYKKLEVANRYLEGAIIDKTSDNKEANTSPKEEGSDEGVTGKQLFETEYALTLNYLQSYPNDVLRVRRNEVRTSLTQIDKRITENKADRLIDQYVDYQELSKDKFSEITGIMESNIDEGNGKDKPNYDKVNKHLNSLSKDLGVTAIKESLLNKFNLTNNQALSIASEYKASGNLGKLKYEEIMTNNPSDSSTVTGSDIKYVSEFTKRLANWYCENANFYSGDIVVKGNPKYRLGNRLFVQDEQNGELWEFYIESVEHTFSYSQGYLTTLGVTRGLQNGGNDRFTHLWGKSEDFSGGMLGEKELQALLDEQAKANKDNEGSSSGGTSSSGGKEYTAGAGTQLAVFPLDVINVTQGENGGYSHMGALAIDFSDGTPHKPYYAPFDCECVYTDSYSGVAWQSQKPVKCVDGSVTYVTLLCVHDNNWASNKVGDKKAKGEVLGHSGTAGQASGDHAHFEVSKNKWSGWSTSSAGVYYIQNPAHLYDVFSIKNNITGKTASVRDGGGYNWRSIDWDDKSGSGSGGKKKVAQSARMARSMPIAFSEPLNPTIEEPVSKPDVKQAVKAPVEPPKTYKTVYGSNVAREATKWAREHSKTESTYQSAFNFGNNNGEDPFEKKEIATDSAGLVWWSFYHAGAELAGGAKGVTTRSLLYDSQLATINSRGQKSEAVFDNMLVGDLVWFNRGSHVGIYCGGGKFVACNGKGTMENNPRTGIVVVDMTKGYWWDKFDGTVRRYR